MRPHSPPFAALLLAAALALPTLPTEAWAQSAPPAPALPGAPAVNEPPTPAAPPAAADPAEDPVVAKVGGQDLRLSEVLAGAAEVLPQELRALPPPALLAMLPPQVLNGIVDRAIAERAVVIAARRAGLDRSPEVLAAVRRAEDQALTQALLHQEVDAKLTEVALRARYERMVAQGGQEEVRARHILVATEADARAALAEIQGGQDFAAVARRRSTDGSAAEGGDLGFFKRADMVPEFAAVAFGLQPGQISPQPVRTPFGWHIIKVEERRRAPTQSFEEARETLRDALVQEEVNAAVQRIRAAVPVERFDIAPPPPPPAPPARPGGLLNDAAPPAPPAGARPPVRR